MSIALPPEAVLLGLRVAAKRPLLTLLADRAATLTGLPASLIAAKVQEREREGSTGLGRGLAIPHARLEELDRGVAVLAVLERPVPFESIDGQPVDLVIQLLSPASEPARHLTELARLARLLKDAVFCERVRGAASAAAASALFQERVSRQAA